MSSLAQYDPIDVQDRDLRIFLGLFEARVMTVHHLAALCFEGRLEAARKRVQKLKAAGYVRERPGRRAYEPAVLSLTRTAFEALAGRGMLDGYPHLSWPALERRVRVSPALLRHEMDVMDVKAAFSAAVANDPRLSLAEFSTWPALYEFAARTPTGEPVIVKPDGFIRLREEDAATGMKTENYFYLEVDRSTEAQGVLARRAACYLDYYRSGGLAERFGRPREAYRAFPFRVLMTFPTAERRNNAAERLLLNRPPVLTMAWLTTMPEATADPLGTIWSRPVDYRDATCGGAFDVARRRAAVYRRNTNRMMLIEEGVSKRKLLGSEAARRTSGDTKVLNV